MYALARPYYHRIRFVATAMAEGSHAVTPEQFDGLLKAPRSLSSAAFGFAGLAVILYLMLFKPTLGMAPVAGQAAARPTTRGPQVELGAKELAFDVERLTTPAGERFTLRFDNTSSVSHNVSIHRGDGEALFTGEVFSGPRVMEYAVPALPAGRYQFVCDVHPQQMTGTLVAR
jgi:plastocyanin